MLVVKNHLPKQGSILESREVPVEEVWQPAVVFLSGESLDRGSLATYSPQSHRMGPPLGNSPWMCELDRKLEHKVSPNWKLAFFSLKYLPTHDLKGSKKQEMHTRLRQKESQENLYISCQKTGKKILKDTNNERNSVKKKTWNFLFLLFSCSPTIRKSHCNTNSNSHSFWASTNHHKEWKPFSQSPVELQSEHLKKSHCLFPFISSLLMALDANIAKVCGRADKLKP